MKTKQILTIGLALATICAGSVLAVEKVEKKKPEPPKKISEPAKPTPPAKPTSPKQSPKKTEPSKKKFDDFIDKNKNGVDDRKEKPGKL